MRTLLVIPAFIALTACSQGNPISEEEKIEIDCLASITVVEITDIIREGAEQGVDPAELQDVPSEKIGEAIQKLNARYSGRMDEAYLEYDINHRLEKIQDALSNRDPDSEATQIMNETLDLVLLCSFWC